MNAGKHLTKSGALMLLLVTGTAQPAVAQDHGRQPGSARAADRPPTARSNAAPSNVRYAKRHSPPVITAGPTRVAPGVANSINSQPVPPGRGNPNGGWDPSRSGRK